MSRYVESLSKHVRSHPGGTNAAKCAVDGEPWPCRTELLERVEQLSSILNKIINVPQFGMFWIDGGSVVIDETVDNLTPLELRLLSEWRRDE
jgi:hypothetical protein